MYTGQIQSTGPRYCPSIEGKVVRFSDTIATLDAPAFGASQHIATIILTVMKHDPAVRSAMNIRFSHPILQACQKGGLRAHGFDRRQSETLLQRRKY